jgi:hypothetical protein
VIVLGRQVRDGILCLWVMCWEELPIPKCFGVGYNTRCAISFGEWYPDIFVFVWDVVINVLFAC